MRKIYTYSFLTVTAEVKNRQLYPPILPFYMKKQLLFVGTLLSGLGFAAPALAQTPVFVQWPLSRANTDSTAVRSANITPGTTTFKHFVISSGQPVTVSTGTTASYAPYSLLYGQAFGWNASGGGWSSNATPPGPGSTVRRGNYEEFSFTANAPVQVDSLIFTASATNTGSAMAGLTYSRSGFTTDSAEFTAGKGPNGVLAATANGTFTAVGSTTPTASAANRLALPQYDATVGNAARTFRMAFSGATGLALTAGQKLTVRLHFAISTTSDGRYILLKNIIVKSKQVALAARPSLASTTLGVYPNPATDHLLVPHASASREAQVLVYNATGAKVASQAAQPGTTETSVSLNALARGLYLVEYTDGGQRSTARIVKQ